MASFESAAQRIASDSACTTIAACTRAAAARRANLGSSPTSCDALRARSGSGTRAVVLAPIGFVCDHVEVLYDLDIEAADVARELGIAARARLTVLACTRAYIAALADSVLGRDARAQ